ncbi:MAG TPA: YggS family pyridoxal phosphate-dependent enzyme [Pantanalinema sp.]
MHQPDLARALSIVRDALEHAATEADRPLDSLRLVAVTKTVPAERLREAYGLGVRVVGENRVQEALEKQAQLSDLALEWHLIGHLQTNKVKQAVGRFSLIHSVDSLRLLEAIDAQARALGIRQDILLQVNVAREGTKSGFSPEEVPAALEEALALRGVAVRGFMAIAPRAADPEAVRPVFRRLRDLRDACQALAGDRADLVELSMGMSADFRTAVAEGATLVRIGTGIFGQRPGNPGAF